ncbi:MAG: adenosine deaminase, partial [Waddliaceae bacterium]
EANPRPEVVAFSIGGPETDYLRNSFRAVYECARHLGLRTTAHAGETSGPEAIWEAIQNLKVDRIAHGIHAPKDPQLMEYLKKHRIPLDVCPTSNLKLGYFSSYKKHPIRLFVDEGIPVTLNSDDPALFNQDLVEEYEILLQKGLFTARELKKIAGESFKQAFMAEELKEPYLSKLSDYPENPD